MLKSIKHACIYDLSASGTRPLLDIHSIIGSPFLKFLATPLIKLCGPTYQHPMIVDGLLKQKGYRECSRLFLTQKCLYWKQ